jgi:hypothetical protein
VTVCETIKILLLYGNRKLKKEGAEAREKEKKRNWLLFPYSLLLAFEASSF